MRPYYEPCTIESVIAAYPGLGPRLDKFVKTINPPISGEDSQKVYFASDGPKTPEEVDLFKRMISEHVTGRSDLLLPRVIEGGLGHSGHVLHYAGARAREGKVDFNGTINWKMPLLTELEKLAHGYDFKVELG